MEPSWRAERFWRYMLPGTSRAMTVVVSCLFLASVVTLALASESEPQPSGDVSDDVDLATELASITPGQQVVTIGPVSVTEAVPNTGPVLSAAPSRPVVSTATTSTPPMTTVSGQDTALTVRLAVGEPFRLELGAGYVWTVSVADETIISRVDGQAIYRALRPGSTSLLVSGDPACHRCLLPSVSFEVRLIVE
jgi:hypothetical protein